MLTHPHKLLVMCFAACVIAFLSSSCSLNKPFPSEMYEYDIQPKNDEKKKNSNNNKKKQQQDKKQPKSEGLEAACKKLGISSSGVIEPKLYIEVASWLGTKYKYGGQTKSGADCSGFTGAVYKNVYGKTLSRVSSDILSINCKRISKNSLREGDLVFFRTDGKRSSVPNHVGIFLKDGKFIHASSSSDCMVSSLSQSYFANSFLCGGRVK